jgi:hypothetical protein
MHENAPAPAQAPVATAPQPLSPVEGQVVDALAVPFAWDAPATDGVRYVLQVASDAAFQDVVATITAGSTASVTLYQSLPQDRDATYHWRVRPDGQRQWGPAAQFQVIGQQTLAAQRAEREAAARARAAAATRRATADIHRHLDDDNEHKVGSTYTAVVLGVIVGSFLLLILLLFLFGQVVYPAEAIT